MLRYIYILLNIIYIVLIRNYLLANITDSQFYDLAICCNPYVTIFKSLCSSFVSNFEHVLWFINLGCIKHLNQDKIRD